MSRNTKRAQLICESCLVLCYDHKIDFDNGKIIDKANYRHRATLESWHTALTANADNNSKHLPEQYRFFIKEIEQLLSEYIYIGGTITSSYLFVTVIC
jgi:hypothetical protein